MNIGHEGGLKHLPLGAAPEEPRVELKRILGMVRRHYKGMIVSSLIAGLLALAFVNVVTPTYRSTVHVLLDESRTGLPDEATIMTRGANVDEYVATQVAMIQSNVVAERIADQLVIDGEGTLALAPSVPAAAAVEMPPLAASDLNERRRVLDAIRRSLNVYRLDRSFVIEIAAQTPDPELSSYIASAIGQAYIEDQVASHMSAIQRTGDWLEERIDDLSQQSLEAAQAVERFRTVNRIVTTGGELISDQQLTGLSNQYVLAQETVARLQTRQDVYLEAIESGDPARLIGLATSLSQPGQTLVFSEAEQAYLTAVERRREIVAQWGAESDQASVMQREIERLGTILNEEARRRLSSFSIELDRARSQLVALSNEMGETSTRSEAANVNVVTMRSLEQRAGSYQSLYQSYLQRYQEIVQQQSLPRNTVRVITDAEQADRPIFPNTRITLALALVLGLGFGAAVGMGREFLDNSLRTGEDVRKVGLDFLGYVPLITRRRGFSGKPVRATVLPGGSPAEKTQLEEALRAVWLALKIRRENDGRTAAFISAVDGEGRSTLTIQLAELAVAQGARTVILDNVGGARSLSQQFAPAAAGGVADVLSGATSVEKVEVRLASGVALLPYGSQRAGRTFGADILSSTQGAALLADLRGRYDLVLLDVPPLKTRAEVQAMTEVIDAFVLVIEWGRTDVQEVRRTIATSSLLRSRIAGAVLNKTKLKLLPQYDPQRRRAT